MTGKSSSTRFNTLLRSGLAIALCGLMVGCGATMPKLPKLGDLPEAPKMSPFKAESPDRTVRRPHTAMRGPAYKRLIITLNESNNLNMRANQYADAIEASGEVDPMTMLEARQLADDIAQFYSDVEWSLANNQRMKWHQTSMDKLWDRFIELYPQDEGFAVSYQTKDMRKRTFKVRLKKEYKEQWGLDFEKVSDQVKERQRQEYLESL